MKSPKLWGSICLQEKQIRDLVHPTETEYAPNEQQIEIYILLWPEYNGLLLDEKQLNPSISFKFTSGLDKIGWQNKLD